MAAISVDSKKTIDSAVMPGVRFTVRLLNRFARAERDLAVAEQTFEYADLLRQMNDLLPAGYFEARKAAATVAAFEADQLRGENVTEQLAASRAHYAALSKSAEDEDTHENAQERRRLDYKAMLIAERYIKPATIRAGLVAVVALAEDGTETPLRIDGVAATIESLLSSSGADFDLLLEEIFVACDEASGLSPSMQKKSASATTTSGPEPTESKILNAEAAGS